MPSDGTTARVDGPSDRRQLPLPDVRAGDHHLLRGASGQPAPEPDPGPGATSILGRAAALRFPGLTDLPGREKIDALADHIVATAIHRGELEELRLEAHTDLLGLRRQWNALLPGGRHRTRALADEARRAIAPALAEDIDTALWLVARCTEQISRLGGDYDAASRTFTILS